MRLVKFLFVAKFLLLFSSSSMADEFKVIRHPDINNSGTEIAFSYQGDIWTVPVSGGRPFRLTVQEAYESRPKWSPDGKFIAFSGTRYGNNDIFVIPAQGGKSRRLTYHSASDDISDWTHNNVILFNSNRNFRQVEWDEEIQAVSSEGGTPFRLMDALGFDAAQSPNGRFIAYVRGDCRVVREAYQGSANKDLWLFDMVNNQYNQLTTFEGQDYLPVWTSDTEIYFLSARSKVYNIYKLNLDKDGNPLDQPEQITNFNEDGIRHFDVSPGGKIVFERTTDIYLMDADTKDIQKVKIDAGSDYRFYTEKIENFTADVNHYHESPDGKNSVLEIHGEIFITENDKEKSKTINISNCAYRDLGPQWLSEKELLFLSDRGGNYEIYLAKSAEDKPLFKTLKHELLKITQTSADESSLSLSPNRKKIAFVQGEGKLIVADIADGKIQNEVTLLEGWSKPEGITWSPDSKWLAYSREDLYFNSEIYIQAADNSTGPVNISMHPRGDHSPEWSRDGSKLAFLSTRNNQNYDVWYIWLKKEDWQKTKTDWEELEEEKPEEEEKNKKEDKADKEEKKEKEVEPIQIDFKDIYKRAVQVTSQPGDEGQVVFSEDGKTIFFTGINPVNEKYDLYCIKWDKSDKKALTSSGADPRMMQLSGDGKYIYVLKKGKLEKWDIGKETFESIAFNAKLKINYEKERMQVLGEIKRTLGNRFYDPEFHGQDWEKLNKHYKEMILSASTKHDFRDMVNAMLGQLNASHMGLYGSDQAKTENESTGRLGIEVTPEARGVKVLRVIPDTPADKNFSKLYVGDLITAVNGIQVTDKINFYSLFTNTTGELVLLRVENREKGEREVEIRPVESLRIPLYNEWVEHSRKLVDQYSKGQLGYLHIQGMDWPSFERFETEFAAAAEGKEGIVIDVRFNGGGWTTDYLMAVLNIKQHAYTIPRGAAKSLKNHEQFKDYYPFAERLPFFPWTKPSVALCNENSYSNAEIFSHAYKTLGLGKLVGKPTFGAVISTGGQGLMDGSYVRVPFRAWYTKATGQNQELVPAVPDFILDNAPDCKVRNQDAQLKKAVEVLLGK
ncbi:MAG: PD40 domain-containing protein [Candidatus Marinimicrobia bacterium]|nr:PD40 domain-containing protein [Candidatus Neomarinimicrobiota bacterium]